MGGAGEAANAPKACSSPNSPKLLDMQPITLTRLVDRLCANGLIERRADAKDRRANRLYLTPGGTPADGKACGRCATRSTQTALGHTERRRS